MTAKFCSRCRTEKTLEDFHRSRIDESGRSRLCKACVNAAVRRRRKPSSAVTQETRARLRREFKREQAVLATQQERDEAWIAEGVARLRADREAIAGGSQ